MSYSTYALSTRSPLASFRSVACAMIAAFAFTACADKGLTPANRTLSPKMTLQLSTVASVQQGFTAKYIWVGAAFVTDKDTALLSFRTVSLASGTQNISLPVDLSVCLAYNASRGKDGCSILVGASLLADSISLGDSTGGHDPFAQAFDASIIGPFDIAPGRSPTIPAIDLSVSRFSVVKWEGDEALRLGGNDTPINTGFGGAMITGVVNGSGAPTLYTVTQGAAFPAIPSNTFLQPYPQLAILQNGAWRRVTATSAPSNTTFWDANALSTSEVYLAAYTGLYKFDGTTVARVSAVSDSIVSLGSATNGQNKFVIAGGVSGFVWVGNTTTWTRYSLPGAGRIDGVCITGAAEAFAASSNTGALYRFDGSAWSSVPATANGGGKIDLNCPAAGQAYVIANNNVLLKWTGSSWSTMPTTGIGTGRGVRWGVASPSEMYAYSDSANVSRVFYKYDGTVWRALGSLRFTQPSGRMWADPRGGAAYVAAPAGRVEQLTAGGPSVISYQPQLRDVMVTSATSAFAVGANLFVSRWDGFSWTVDAPPANTNTTRVLQGVWSDGPKNAWAVGGNNTVMRFDGTAWTLVSDSRVPVGPVDSYNAVWGAGSEVWIAGENSMLHCASPTSCTSESTAGAGILYGLWGSSRSNIIAVGAGGRITRYNGTGWSQMASPTTRNLARVAGSGPSDIWAVGDSVLLHYDGTQWSNYSFSGLQYMRSRVPSQQQFLFQVGLWVRGPKEAYVGGENGSIARWDGSSWNEMDSRIYRRRILGISGVGSCVLAVTDGQSDVPSQTLWRGIGANGCFVSPMKGPSVWP
ncbi:MAG: hypothetical protein NTZ43_06085 [Gemmatimonadetes bacterium]|nr:hypothetical protein [Gemmatimonadota bacterium]